MLKGFYGKEPLVRMEREAVLDDGNPEKIEDEEESRAQEEDEGTENEKKVNRWLIDDVVKDLIEMELDNSKKEGVEEGFEEGSLHWLKFKIWKVEQDWKEEQAGAAETSNKMRGADKDKPRERADKSNIMKESGKATKQNKQMENSKDGPEYKLNLVFDSETEASSDPETGGEETKEDLIPQAETTGAEALESTACEKKHEPAGEARPQLKILQPLAPESRETQQRAERLWRRLREAAAEEAHVARGAPVHTPGVRDRSAVVEPGNSTVSAHKDGAQAGIGDRETGREAGLRDREEGPEEAMKPRDLTNKQDCSRQGGSGKDKHEYGRARGSRGQRSQSESYSRL